MLLFGTLNVLVSVVSVANGCYSGLADIVPISGAGLVVVTRSIVGVILLVIGRRRGRFSKNK